MSPISIGILAISMSVDAFIASLGRGAQSRRPDLGHALRTGVIFGAVEAITPLIGWTLGIAASQYVETVDHWIAFTLLAGVGIHMILQALRTGGEEAATGASFWAVVATAVGTSIDAMAVGVSLAFLDVNIIVIALAIGFATMVMSSTGLLAGRLLGRRFGRVIEMAGGLALMALGAGILYEHVTGV